MKVTMLDRNTARRGNLLSIVGGAVLLVLAFSLSAYVIQASAGAIFAAPLCGDGSAPDYGFTYDLQQAHWTVDWQNYASEQAVTEVDAVLDRLNGDSIAQTMILIKSQAEVGNRVNCAVHFLRYMKLGQPSGERKDNGFVFLIVVEPTRIDVHYGVGLGLPALTASELTTLNRAAEAAYQSTQSMDQALLTLVQGFDTVVRSNYSPLLSPTSTPETINLPSLPSRPLGILSLCCLLCLGTLFLMFLLWAFSQLARRGITFDPSGSGSWGRGFPSGGSRGGFGGGRGGFGGGRGSSPTRGGSGSGRSGRGN
jgi:hypothetical protein